MLKIFYSRSQVRNSVEPDRGREFMKFTVEVNMEKDFDLDVRVAVAPVQDTTQGFASIGSTCWSCNNASCGCPITVGYPTVC